MSEQLALDAIVALPAHVVDEFELWWTAYPRKVAKVAARGAWVRARRSATAIDLGVGLARYRFSSDPERIPHAATWLNGERWKDEADDRAADPWGLNAWLAKADPGASGTALFHITGYERDAIADILEAAGLPAIWRGDLGILDRWLANGYRPDSIAAVVAETAATIPGVVQSLGAFDRSVRRHALHWNARRHEWVRDF